MESFDFKESLIQLLSATGYSLNLKTDQLSSLEVYKHLKPFFDWFTLNISVENCINNDELNRFNSLKENNEIVYGEELDGALQYYQRQAETEDHLLPYNDVFSENIEDEITHLKEQLELKTELLKTVRTSVSALNDDNCKINNEIQKVEAHTTDTLKDLVSLNKTFNSKLQNMKRSLDEMLDKLSALDPNNEISADEGIDTLLSDKLSSSTWSLSSVTSTQSTSTNKGSSAKYFCQLPFHQYEKQQIRFCKIADKLTKRKIGRSDEEALDVQLELLSITKRLVEQKRSYVKMFGKLEGLKAGINKIKELCLDVNNMSLEEIRAKLRRELAQIREDPSELSNSIVGDEDELGDELEEVCEKWAEFETLKPMCNILEENMENYNQFLTKLDEIKQLLRVKVEADMLMCEILQWERQRIEACVEMFLKVEEMVKTKLETTNRRIEVMEANNQDYETYCSLPVENRCDLVEWLAAMMGSDRKNLVQAMSDLNNSAQAQHESLIKHCTTQMETIISVEHEMKELYNKEMQSLSSSQNNGEPYMYQTIKNTLSYMCAELLDAISHCEAMQNGVFGEEEIEIQEMLNKLLSQLSRNSNGL